MDPDRIAVDEGRRSQKSFKTARPSTGKRTEAKASFHEPVTQHGITSGAL
jgi:hypothetical protein